MSDPYATTKDHGEPGLYEIRIKGHLHNRWIDRFGGLTITLEGNGETRLTGPVVDQAALHGLLRTVRDLGLPLVSVVRVASDRPDGPTIEPHRAPPAHERRPT
jgi:hypothetical protein